MAMPRRRWSNVTASAILCVTLAGCRVAHDWLPRTHTTARSPDGRYTAFVRQAFNIDPPDDHLYLVRKGGSPRHLMALAPDADWCHTIVWTNDSRRVAFLIRDQQLAVFDAATVEQVALLPLVRADGYPGSEGARAVTLGEDGVTVSYERFARADGRALRRESTRIPDHRLVVRLTWADNNKPVEDVWVRVRLADAREVTIPITPGVDGVARLPAIDEGRFAIVEIVVPGLSGSAILRDVQPGTGTLPVTLARASGRLALAR